MKVTEKIKREHILFHYGSGVSEDELTDRQLKSFSKFIHFYPLVREEIDRLALPEYFIPAHLWNFCSVVSLFHLNGREMEEYYFFLKEIEIFPEEMIESLLDDFNYEYHGEYDEDFDENWYSVM